MTMVYIDRDWEIYVWNGSLAFAAPWPRVNGICRNISSP